MAVQSALPSANLFCINCGYNQRGITADHCPECGQDFSKLPPSSSRLPWLHRRYRGLLRTYWRTVLMVIFRPKEFSEQIDNPITLRDARLFWLITLIHALVPIPGTLIQLYVTPSIPGSVLRQIQILLFEPIYLPLPVSYFLKVGLFPFIIFATGMPSYFCHPPSIPIQRQNRAIALSYFASAPLALVPFIVGSMLLAQLSSPQMPIRITFQILAAGMAVFMLGAWYIRTVGMVLVLSQRRHRILTALMLTCAWIVVAALTLIIFPLVLGYLVRVIQILL